MKRKGNFIWWVLGFVIIPSIFVLLRNEFMIKTNRPTPEELAQFCKNIVQISYSVPESGGEFLRSVYHASSSLIGYKANMGTIYQIKYYNSAFGKYFILTLFDMKNKTFSLDYILWDKRIYLYVNSEDLENPEYGTKERPIPAFSFKGIDEPILIPVGNDRHENLEPTQAEFEHNVRCYLTYVMSKEEFKARFKDQKK